MSPNTWGPPIWTLFHTLAEKIKEEEFTTLMPQIIFNIRKICSALPCPECSQHAMEFFKKVNVAGIKSKEDLRNLLCLFHNLVNKRKGKSLLKHDLVSELYSNKNLIEVYNNFIRVYQTNGNMNQLAESFQRKLIVLNFKKWIMQNFIHFS
jgi:hypothetical protein